jgi:hypothetical protein
MPVEDGVSAKGLEANVLQKMQKPFGKMADEIERA